MTSTDPFASPIVGGGSNPSSQAKGRPSRPAQAPEPGARARGVASGGKAPNVPDMPGLPQWSGPVIAEETYIPSEEFDAKDVSDINRELNRVKTRLFKVGQALDAANAELAEAELIYDRHYRRALVRVTGGSAEIRKAVAELECEPYENDLAVKRQVCERLKRLVGAVRHELDAVQGQSHNMRSLAGIR